MSLSWTLAGPFFRPQSRPTDSATSVIGHIHLIQTHQGRYCSGFCRASRGQTGAGSQGQQYALNIKEQWTQADADRKKKKIEKKKKYRGHGAGLHKNTKHVSVHECMNEKPYGDTVRLTVIIIQPFECCEQN